MSIPPDKSEPGIGCSSAVPASPGSRKTILVVEDDELNCKLLRHVPLRAAFQLIEAPTGTEGIELARTRRPDLILMDVCLPDINGLDATVRIGSDPVTTHIPVVAVTAFAMREDRELALQAGCSGYLTKPLDLKAFVHEVRRQLGDPGAPAAQP